jgi:hypothetical protein
VADERGRPAVVFGNLVLVPMFLAALLVVRGLRALLYRGFMGGREITAAALLQSTSLPFIVAATAIGQELRLVDGALAAALVAAMLLFPLGALGLLSRDDPAPPTPSTPGV